MPPCRDAAARHAAAATPCAATLRRHYFIDYAITPPFSPFSAAMPPHCDYYVAIIATSLAFIAVC
jgi:hypothetical protein